MHMPQEIIDWIMKNLSTESVILELGSGEGTKLLVDLGYTVYSIEQDPEWRDKYHDNYIHADLIYYPEYDCWWYDIEVLKEKLPAKYDCILVDGPAGDSGVRKGFIRWSDLFNMDVTVIIDDTSRIGEHELVLELQEKMKNEGYMLFSNEISTTTHRVITLNPGLDKEKVMDFWGSDLKAYCIFRKVK